MSNVSEFVEIRQNVEALALEITLSIKNKAKEESLRNLDEAKRNLEVLKAMVANDVQVIVVGRLSIHLANLETKIANLKVSSPTRKRSATRKVSIPIRPQIDERPQIVVFERP